MAGDEQFDLNEDPGDEGNDFEPMKLSEVDESKPYARTDERCYTRLNTEGTKLLVIVSRKHKLGDFFEWAAVHAGRTTGSFCLTPTHKDNPDRIAVSWAAAGAKAGFSLRKILKSKNITVPPDHTLLIPCGIRNLKKGGAALELIFAKRTLEPVEKRSPAPPDEEKTR